MNIKNSLKTGIMALTLVLASIPALSYAATLSRNLQIGSSGADVSALQTFLAQDATLYPQGLVTGYYGFLTKAAVSNFQNRNGISAIGRVGPITLAAINLQMTHGMGTNSATAAPYISGVTTNASRNSTIVNWNTNEYAQGLVYYSSSPLTTYENTNSVTVSGNTVSTDSTLRTSQNVLIQGLQPGTIYYYLIYTTDQAGNVSVTWPSTFQTTN